MEKIFSEDTSEKGSTSKHTSIRNSAERKQVTQLTN